MHRPYALSLGTVAFALVTARGALCGEPVGDAVPGAIVALVVFALAGGVAGRIADYLVRQDVETRYRRRVQWYRDAVAEQQTE